MIIKYENEGANITNKSFGNIFKAETVSLTAWDK